MGTRRYQRGRFARTYSSKRAPSVAGNGVSQHAHEIARPSFIGGSTITILYSAPQLEHLKSIGPSFFLFTRSVLFRHRHSLVRCLMTVLRQKLAPFGQRFVFVRQSTPDVPALRIRNGAAWSNGVKRPWPVLSLFPVLVLTASCAGRRPACRFFNRVNQRHWRKWLI